MRSRLVIGMVWLLAAGTADAQPAAPAPAETPRWFAEGAVVLWASAGAPKDPDGPGYLSPYFHGNGGGLAVGGLLGAGVHLTGTWSVGAELAAHWPDTGTITEASRTHSEQTTVSSTYRVREMLASLAVGWGAGLSGTTEVRPVIGMTVSSTRQSLTSRSGQYSWYGGTLPVTRPDVAFSHVHFGGMIGADLRRRSNGPLSLTATVRVHWISRPENSLPYREAPALGPVVLFAGAGVSWTRQAARARPLRLHPRRD